ncbi:MAG: acyl-CoA carboxylase subunit beta [Nanoarchaeota archaeon]|nr:acyl-CoA carboxylase subunit beta [Nanoarchaeota archaeon]
MEKETKEFEKRKNDLINADKNSIEKQHKKGKLNAIERIHLLLDSESFVEIGSLMEHTSSDFGLDKKKIPRDGVVTGYGTIDGKRVFLYSQDFSSHGGTLGSVHSQKIKNIIELAIKSGSPVIGLFDSGGARIEEGIEALDGFGKIFSSNVKANGIIPQISIILGPCAGGAAYSPGLTDFVFMVDGISNMFVTGPKVIKKVTGENVDMKTLGSAQMHTSKSGVAHFIYSNENDCLEGVKKLISYMPSNYLEYSPIYDIGDPIYRTNPILKDIVPEDPQKSYNVKDVINEIFDKESFFEIHEHFANNVVIGFAYLNGFSIGIVANQPLYKAGSIDILASEKISKFVNFCDSFNIPIINLVDVPGYLPGTDQETNGIIKYGAGVLYAYSNSTIPKIALIMRKAYGGAYIAMCSKELNYDMVFAWPYAQIAVMGAEQACEIIYHKEIATEKKFNFTKKVQEYEKKYLNPYLAAKNGSIDEVIEIERTREVLIKTFEIIKNKRKKKKKTKKKKKKQKTTKKKKKKKTKIKNTI